MGRVAALLLAATWLALINRQALTKGSPAGAILKTAGSTVCPRKRGVLDRDGGLCPAVLDDNSTWETTWGPWSYRPHCVTENKRGKPKTGLEENMIKYCLYTNDFFGEYGISILARPEAAATAAGIIQEAYDSTFPSPETVQYLNLEPAYEVVDMSEKGGKGVVATRHIAKRETFMVDFAAIVGDVNVWGSVSERDGRKLLDLASEQLASSEHIQGLSQGAGGIGVEGVIRANTFRTHLDGVPQKTLFPRISRINHGCKPNAMLRFSSGGLMAGVAAFRDIELGEEITISYIDLTDTSQIRASKLREWGFTCSCSLCSAPAAELAASDARRQKLAEGISPMVEALQRGDAGGAINFLQTALRNLADEGLEAISEDLFEGLARIYWAVGDKATATEYARKSVNYRADFAGDLEPTNRATDLKVMLAGFD